MIIVGCVAQVRLCLHRFRDLCYTHLVVFLLTHQNYTCLSLDTLKPEIICGVRLTSGLNNKVVCPVHCISPSSSLSGPPVFYISLHDRLLSSLIRCGDVTCLSIPYVYCWTNECIPQRVTSALFSQGVNIIFMDANFLCAVYGKLLSRTVGPMLPTL